MISWQSSVGARAVVLFAGVFFTLPAASKLSAQSPAVLTVTAAPTCSTCRLDIVKQATLGSPSDSVGPVFPVFALALTSDGRYYLAESSGPSRFIFVYDHFGRFQRTLGRDGDGPGEFKRIQGLVAHGDSLLAYEVGGKFSIFDRRGILVDEGRMPFTPRQLIRSNHRGFIGWADIRSTQLAGKPIHVYDLGGKYLKSISGESHVIDPRKKSLVQKSLATGLGGFVALDTNSKSVEFYRSDGILLKILRLTGPWMSLKSLQWRTYKSMMSQEQTYRAPLTPPPRLDAVSVDHLGRLWVLGAVEDPNWRRLGFEFSGPKALDLTPSFYDKAWDSIVEVIDPTNGRLLHREKLPFFAEGFLAPGLVVRPTEDKDGWLRIEIWRLELPTAPVRK